MTLSSKPRSLALFAALATACMLFAVVFAGNANAQSNEPVDPDRENPDIAVGFRCGGNDFTGTRATSPQGAVNVAEDGDTILVCGSFRQIITIDKRVGIISDNGAEARRLTAQTGSNVVTLVQGADGTTVEGFTIADSEGSFGIGTSAPLENISVIDNIITDNVNIGVAFGAGNSGGVVSGNEISDNGRGVYLSTGTSDTEITDNVISGTTSDEGGITFEANNARNTVQSNNIVDNVGAGVFFFGDSVGGNFADNNISFNRIFGNETGIDNDSTSPIVAENNFFGCNEGPNAEPDDGCDTTEGNVNTDPFLVLTATADPDTVETNGGMSTVTASLRTNSMGDTIAPDDFILPDVGDVVFEETTGLGTLADPTTVPIMDGEATVEFTSGNTVGIAEVDATHFNATDTAEITINPPAGTPAACEEPGAIVGTDGDDLLIGTPGDDVICGLGGDDDIRGLGGDDTIFGGAGDDTILGGSGENTIFAGSGDDTILGGSGDDLIFGQAGNNLIFGQEGNDRIRGGSGNDRLRGGPGENDLRGIGGNNEIRGGNDNDTIFGGPNNSIIFGGGGDDFIAGQTGVNRIAAGPGDDRVNVRDNAPNDAVDGGAGNNTCVADVGDRLANCQTALVR